MTYSTPQAYVGGLYYDQGLDSVREWLRPIFKTEIERAFGLIGGFVDGAGDGRLTFMGDGRIAHADLVVAGWLLWMQFVTGKESEEWKAVEGWHGGRWKKLLDLLEPYYDYSK